MFFCLALGSNVKNADEWLKYSDQQMRGDRSKSVIEMSISTPNWSRELMIDADIDGKDFALIEITSPAKEKGIRTLRLENNMWNYFPKLKRKVAVSSSMLLASWMGSDFTNDDILKASSMSEDYTHTFLKDEKIGGETYKVIENKVKAGAKSIWPKVITYASPKDCLPRIQKYYDKKGTLKREMTLSDVKKYDNHLVPSRWEMVPLDEKGKKTTITYQELKFDVKFPANHFTQQSLSK
jgi:outer membrane lipoprotein-sorting protein